MKSKVNMKLLFFLLAILFLILTIFFIRTTYARYITALTAKSYVEMGSWLIRVNDQNIIENSDVSDVITPVFNSNTEYIADGKISPTSTGHVKITIDYQEVTVPFKYEVSFENDANTVLEDFKFISYSFGDETAIPVNDSNSIITDIITLDETTRTQTLKLNFAWIDGEGETLNDIQDTAYSRNVDELGLRFKMAFTQLI